MARTTDETPRLTHLDGTPIEDATPPDESAFAPPGGPDVPLPAARLEDLLPQRSIAGGSDRATATDTATDTAPATVIATHTVKGPAPATVPDRPTVPAPA